MITTFVPKNIWGILQSQKRDKCIGLKTKHFQIVWKVKRGTGFSRRINGNLINYITFSYKLVDNIYFTND